MKFRIPILGCLSFPLITVHIGITAFWKDGGYLLYANLGLGCIVESLNMGNVFLALPGSYCR